MGAFVSPADKVLLQSQLETLRKVPISKDISEPANLKHRDLMGVLIALERRLQAFRDSGTAASSGSARQDPSLHHGARVRIHGLLNAVELNNKTGTLVGFEAGTGRWTVRLHTADQGSKALKPENLT